MSAGAPALLSDGIRVIIPERTGKDKPFFKNIFYILSGFTVKKMDAQK